MSSRLRVITFYDHFSEICHHLDRGDDGHQLRESGTGLHGQAAGGVVGLQTFRYLQPRPLSNVDGLRSDLVAARVDPEKKTRGRHELLAARLQSLHGLIDAFQTDH